MQDVLATIELQLDEAKAKERQARAEVKSLERAKSALRSVNGTSRTLKGYDPEKAAGQKNIEAVASYLSVRGKARQIDIANDLKKNSGTVSCALQVLERRGDAVSKGRLDRSQLWEWTGETKTAKIKQREKLAA